jgi:serine protease Do
MNTRTRTIASFFTIAMAAMLLGSLVSTQMQRPGDVLARPAEAATPAPTDPVPDPTFGLNTFREIARANTAGVVNINTSKTVRRQRSRDPFREFFGDDMMERFFGPQRRDRGQTLTSLGSGFVIDKDGYILTNRHVVDEADQINVTLSTSRNGRTYPAKLVGKDARTDVALLKIEAKEPLTVVRLGDSERTEVGDWVMAIGNPFGLGGNSVTVGVVSYKGRALNIGPTLGTPTDMIQTDASINPGNSGGPLLNTRGEVIGINTLIITQGMSQQSSGVGFAVPINVAKDILPQLRDKGKVVRGWLGVQIGGVDEDTAKTFKMKEAKGAVIVEVSEDSPAEKAGIKPEDVVVAIDGRPVEDNSDLSRYIASRAPGTTVKLQVLRDGSERTISVTLGTFPDEVASADSSASEARAQLGMSLRNLTPDLAERLDMPRAARGVIVMDVEPGEAAERAGLRPQDVIVSANGAAVTDVEALEKAIEAAESDGVVRLRVRRRDGGYGFVILRLK